MTSLPVPQGLILLLNYRGSGGLVVALDLGTGGLQSRNPIIPKKHRISKGSIMVPPVGLGSVVNVWNPTQLPTGDTRIDPQICCKLQTSGQMSPRWCARKFGDGAYDSVSSSSSDHGSKL
ncbi:hypothetical protein AVEN_156543-1 [Araneus ventricosus]|uniref:Uncharacterized protein n=1 Tax=Araneus ventricosus TaxID=182803 RepID=A0A4Y2PBQ3_ARAVE|nr:hypothetical protein AVEN_156543-1 [Araneus ventricosus]